MNAFRKAIFLIGVFGFGVCFSTPEISAQEGMATDEGLELTGLILDETKTRAGREFFESFSNRWREFRGLDYTITIMERPDAARGSFIMVSVDDTRVYLKRMIPRWEWIEEESQTAVRYVSGYLLQRLTTQKQLEKEFQF